MNHILKFYQKNNLEIKIPNNKDKTVLIKVLNIEKGVDSEWNNEVNVITLKIENREDFKYFTEPMFEFFVKKELETHMSLFSVEGELILSFR